MDIFFISKNCISFLVSIFLYIVINTLIIVTDTYVCILAIIHLKLASQPNFWYHAVLSYTSQCRFVTCYCKSWSFKHPKIASIRQKADKLICWGLVNWMTLAKGEVVSANEITCCTSKLLFCFTYSSFMYIWSCIFADML